MNGRRLWAPWIPLSAAPWGQLSTCIIYLGHIGTRMHQGTKISCWRKCDVLGNVLLGNPEPDNSCVAYFDIFLLPEHLSSPGIYTFMAMTPFSRIMCSLHNLFENGLQNMEKSFRCCPDLQISPDIHPIKHLWFVLKQHVWSTVAPHHAIYRS